ncbi:GNAT family N-acetyltransferase [Helcobacillus massiliensis]|uniref:Ribosomal protein S18 acetylase RimI-like enzyme n=1 Tax=Helcobacillus massiliensis TaxID=521392 RepID=A0A839QYN1_9MICO|nr:MULTISPECIES: GNAT family N-acetyltransferase [Helcobacillus]MBB3023061.1 ribosomal protein S18 acetylase RimI-like enzyme [Helcobacillus massiliensis]MCG7426074.1 GNAT family N-acetyltransferase [Helcobacillus sp. ACRRO]MCT1558649.1 GNAT family N-acetyltransferase [Helcobacillus massiliensis]MCT2037251.1 GNAT family N-acetyltransferase [Helcobacillus massiliensis]MCT2332871.1 GNAT family N-acetyltransferase [Helcobacillus massiliensis]
MTNAAPAITVRPIDPDTAGTDAAREACARVARLSAGSHTIDVTESLNKFESRHHTMFVYAGDAPEVADEASIQAGPDPVGWAIAQDRAAGRINAVWAIDPTHPSADAVADVMVQWLMQTAGEISAERGLAESMLVAEVEAEHAVRMAALERAGFEKVRTWLTMQIPLSPAATTESERDDPRYAATNTADSGDLVIRTVESQEDKEELHRVLELAFRDHFNYYRETFEEFEERVEMLAGHAWDLDFVAEHPERGIVGALITGSSADGTTAHAEYLGVSGDARGLGAASSLLTVFQETYRAAGFTTAELQVDADSPTGADKLYRKLGYTPTAQQFTYHHPVSAPQG